MERGRKEGRKGERDGWRDERKEERKYEIIPFYLSFSHLVSLSYIVEV